MTGNNTISGYRDNTISGRSSSRSGGHHESSGRSAYSRSRHAASGTGSLKLKKDLLSKSVDYSDMDTVREGEKGVTRKQRSKSIDHLNQSQVASPSCPPALHPGVCSLCRLVCNTDISSARVQTSFYLLSAAERLL